jgi:hypothetical protein
MRGKDLLSLSFRVIGLLFAAIGAAVAIWTGMFVGRAEAVPGTVIDYAVEQNAISFMRAAEPTGMLYYPVVRYATTAGETRTLTGRRGRTARTYEIGAEVPVLVSPGDPDDARINTVFGVWGSAIILGGLGALFLLLSVLAPFGFGGSRGQ